MFDLLPESDIGSAILVGILAGAVLGISELLRVLGASREQSRKSAHIGSGLLACSFPWLFESPLTVLVLTGGFAALVMIAKSIGQLQGVHGVERESHGAALFPVVIALLFWMTDGDPVAYGIPILVLTVSDAAAALIGKGYGVKHYKAMGEQRSIEGSLTFFTVTFLAVHLPLLLSGQTERLDSILIAFVIAVLATCIEAISVRGMDNLFIPMMVAYALANFLGYSPAEIQDRSIAICAFGLFGIAAHKLRFMTFTGSIAGFLCLYATYSLGGAAWAFPLIAFYVVLLVLTHILSTQAPVEPVGLSRVFQSMVVEVLIVLWWANDPQPALYVAFLAALSGTSALVIARVGGQLGNARGMGPSSALLAGAAGAILAPTIGYAYLPEAEALHAIFVAVAGGWACLALFASLRLTTARFQCVECQEQLSEPRHCGQAAEIIRGNRYWTTNRAGMTSIALVALVVWIAEKVRVVA